MKNYRTYGDKPFEIAILHGGPGAQGEVAPVARELSSIKGTIEPLQTASSIDSQVNELEDVLKNNCKLPVILIGWSWGAWLGFIFASKHPEFVKKLILVSSGPFEEKYAENITLTRLNRLNSNDKYRVRSIMNLLNSPSNVDKNNIMSEFVELISKTDSYDPMPHDDEIIEFQYEVYRKIWREAEKLRRSGKLTNFGRKIKCPVVAIHGDYDPHHYLGVKEPLSRVLVNFKFYLLKNCGHYPWIEKKAKDEFYTILKNEIN